MTYRTARESLLATIGDDIATLSRRGPTLVAVDGVDGAGKSHFADELVEALAERDMQVVRASVDGFHNPPDVRYRRGRDSPEGFFHDSYDYGSLRARLLEPFRRRGGQFVRAVYDVDQEQPVDHAVELGRDRDVLVLDGIFLHRPELRSYWDYSIFLQVDFAVSIPRGAQRGYGDPIPTSASNRRYVEGQRIYLSTCRPHEHATVVIDNNHLARAHVIRRNSATGTTTTKRWR